MGTLPKKFLRIHELTFILPDNFNGTVEEALTHFLEYHIENCEKGKYCDPHNLFSPLQILIGSSGDERVCGDAAIYALSDDNRYELIDGTNPVLAERRREQLIDDEIKSSLKEE